MEDVCVFDGSYSSDIIFPQDTAFRLMSLSPHSSVFLLQTKRGNYKFQKLHYFGTRLWFKKIGQVQTIKFQVCLLWQGPHLAKFASKGIYKIRLMETFLFLPFFWLLWSVFTIQLDNKSNWTTIEQQVWTTS